jgi:hypothetical protein
MSQTEEKIVKIIDADTHTRGASVEQVGSQGALIVKTAGADSAGLPGLNVPSADEIAVTYPDGDTEVYTYKNNSVTVATITVTYSSGSLVSVVKALP